MRESPSLRSLVVTVSAQTHIQQGKRNFTLACRGLRDPHRCITGKKPCGCYPREHISMFVYMTSCSHLLAPKLAKDLHTNWGKEWGRYQWCAPRSREVDTGPPSGGKRMQCGIALPIQGAYHRQSRTLHLWAACNMNRFWSHEKAWDLHVITCFLREDSAKRIRK